jgi:SNF2 family DNA or RNA helicase
MHVSLVKDKLHVQFPFDKVLVTTVSNFPGSKWNAKKKLWTIPVAHIVLVFDTLSSYGFHFSDEVHDHYRSVKKSLKKVSRIKQGIFNEVEENAFKELGLPFYDYQKIGAGFICAGRNIIIADQPGLGKTLQSLGATRIRNAQKVLIFAPKTAKKTWKDEIKKWLKEDSVVVVGGSPKQRKEQWESDSKYYIANYHLLLRDLQFMKKIDWDFVIADEATDVSNPEAKTTKALKKIKARHKVALTGTPISNTIKDIWSILDWVQPKLLGTFSEFQKEYCMKDKYGSIIGYKNLSKLKAKIEPYFIRRLKSQVLHELPPKTYEDIYSEFSEEERRLYVAIQEEILEDLKIMGMTDRKYLSKALVKMLRLKQMTGTSELINNKNVSAKMDDLKDLLRIILSGDDKAIIFTQFREMAVILMRELKDYKPLLIAGGIDEDQRGKNQDMFNEDEEHKLLIMTAAGSRSLNLQRASYVIHYDLPWSISQTEQREDRAHRNGQKQNVTIYRMLVKDSIDEYNLGVLNSKQGISNRLLDEGDEQEVPNVSEETVMEILNSR